ncbi:uncharacterized protein [Thunnus thynnus]|uniref:uncharacterized protein isoform X1 n=2 Tax=Thunnus thynnus TaxID=8237 RepID=UPI003529A2EF
MDKSNNSRQKSYRTAQPQNPASSRVQHDLRQALLGSKAENEQLLSENTALRNQIATMELIWKHEKKSLKDEIDSLVSTLFMARNDMDNLVQMVESTRASLTKSETECRQMARRVTQISLEKDDLVRAVMDKEKALAESIVNQQETEIQQRAWCEKYHALQNHLALEQEEKKTSRERMQELMAERKKTEEQWHRKERIMEQEMRLLILKNIELQELALKTDREKVQMKKQEEKAKRETEKRLKKERKENEKREKEEKKENDRKEKENLKRQKKEKMKEEKERKESEKREKKEKEENDRKEKENLKRQKKEKEKEEKEKAKREKKEKKRED